MSGTVCKWAWDQHPNTQFQKHVLVALGWRFRDGYRLRIGVEDICEMVDGSDKGVRNALKALADQGLIALDLSRGRKAIVTFPVFHGEQRSVPGTDVHSGNVGTRYRRCESDDGASDHETSARGTDVGDENVGTWFPNVGTSFSKGRYQVPETSVPGTDPYIQDKEEKGESARAQERPREGTPLNFSNSKSGKKPPSKSAKHRAQDAWREIPDLAANSGTARASDPVAERIIQDMGGWGAFGRLSARDLKDRGFAFRDRYEAWINFQEGT